MNSPPPIEVAAATVWAKSAPYSGEVESWLPLWQHLDDTADVAGRLWDEWLAPVTRNLIAGGLPGGLDDGRRLVRWLAGSHDLGKASPAFSVQVPALQNLMAEQGLVVGPLVCADRSKLRHEIAGAAIVERWLESEFDLDPDDAAQFTGVIAGHHGTYPEVAAIIAGRRSSSLLGRGLWTDVQDLLAARAAHRAGAYERLAAWHGVALSPAVQMQLTGIVVMADWIASTPELFPLRSVGEPPAMPGAGVHDSRRVDRAWKELQLSERWSPDLPQGSVSDVFADRFPRAGGEPRPVQEAASRLATTMSTPGIMIVEAPMGEGKTEAALLAAEALAARSGCAGVFVALPTQATSNAMFQRVLDWLGHVPDPTGAGAQSVALVHGKAALNDTFTSLRVGRYASDITGEGDNAIDQDPAAARPRHLSASVHEWMRGRKRAALSDFVVGTIDQVLFAALVARHVMLRQLSLTPKVVVIDEVHGADIYMSQFLDRSLEWLASCGTPVVLLSATLPASRRVELYSAYARGRQRFLGLEPLGEAERSRVRHLLGARLGYPSVVVTTDDGPSVESLAPSGRGTSVTLHRLDDDLTSLGDLLEARLHDGGCAVVIRNTVTRVQAAAEYLADRFGQDAVTVAHAQFLAIDRAANDADLLRRFGPPGGSTERPEARHIVVATQVVEQSLDVDFDLMVTDIAPADLVLQRMGRLHRHVRPNRPAAVAKAQCYLTGVDWAQTPPRPDRGSAAVYGRWPLYRSLAVLADRWDGGVVRLPEDIPALVQDAYDEAWEVPAEWKTVVDAAWVTHRKRADERAAAAQNFALPPVGAAGTDLYAMSRGSAGAIDEDSRQGQAMVRDGSESVEVVVLQRGADGVDRILDGVEGGGPLPLRHVPVPYEQARLLARCTVRLPSRLLYGKTFDDVLDELESDYFEGWRTSGLLSGQLALVLDDDATRTIAGFRLRYDRRNGLVVTRDD